MSFAVGEIYVRHLNFQFCGYVNTISLYCAAEKLRIELLLSKVTMWLWIFVAAFCLTTTATEDIGPDTCGQDRTKLANW